MHWEGPYAECLLELQELLCRGPAIQEKDMRGTGLEEREGPDRQC